MATALCHSYLPASRTSSSFRRRTRSSSSSQPSRSVCLSMQSRFKRLERVDVDASNGLALHNQQIHWFLWACFSFLIVSSVFFFVAVVVVKFAFLLSKRTSRELRKSISFRIVGQGVICYIIAVSSCRCPFLAMIFFL